jgi:hypothetical protein
MSKEPSSPSVFFFACLSFLVSISFIEDLNKFFKSDLETWFECSLSFFHGRDQDEGHIMKAARKKRYIMFPATISFLNDMLKAELGVKSKKEKEEDADDEFCSLKVPIDHKDKDSKTYTVKVLITQVRLAHKYPISPWEMIHPPWVR